MSYSPRHPSSLSQHQQCIYREHSTYCALTQRCRFWHLLHGDSTSKDPAILQLVDGSFRSLAYHRTGIMNHICSKQNGTHVAHCLGPRCVFGSMYHCRNICASEAECVTTENLVTGAFELHWLRRRLPSSPRHPGVAWGNPGAMCVLG